ncbi:MAG TPA: SCO family protein [Gemmata sp.]
MKARLLLFGLALAALGGGYSSPPQPHTGSPPPPPRVGTDQRLGGAVPLHLPFKDAHGGRVTLGACVAGRPTVLVLAYYRCPMLCTQVLNGLLAALRALPDSVGDTFNVVVVSFDPREKPPLAALKKAAYVGEYGRPGAERGWHFLTGDPLAIAALADAVGFRYEYDAGTEQYAHGSGLVVLGPDGTISRYLFGVRFEPRDLRLALAEASAGKVGSPADQALLLCYRYDPATGTYTFAVLRFVKWFSAAALVGIVGLVGTLAWRGRGRGPRPAPEGHT